MAVPTCGLKFLMSCNKVEATTLTIMCFLAYTKFKRAFIYRPQSNLRQSIGESRLNNHHQLNATNLLV